MRAEDLLHTTTELYRDIALVSLEGELDLATAPLLTEAVTQALEARPRELTLDTASLSFCDATGLRALLQARRAAQASQAEFRLVGVRPRLRRNLTLLRAGHLLPPPPAPGEGSEADLHPVNRCSAGALPVGLPTAGLRLRE